MWDWVGLIDPDFMLSVVTCAQYGGWSDTGFCDKTYDTMYSQQQVTPNQAKRRAIVWKMQSILYDQRPYLWLATEDSRQRRLAEVDRPRQTRCRARSTRCPSSSLTDVHQT